MNKPLPSDHYFNTVITEGDYLAFKSSGMAWEWEPHCPASWEEHQRLYSVWLKHKEYDGS